MKQVLKLALSVSVVMLGFSCRNSDSFTINGKILNAGKARKVYLLAADSAGMQPSDSTNLSVNGEFQFRGMTACPNLYKLRIGDRIFDLIVENGDIIKIQTDFQDTTHVVDITGSQATMQLRDWDNLNRQYTRKNQELVNRYRAELQQVDKNKDSLLNVFSLVYQRLSGEFAEKTLHFALSHENSLSGFYAVNSLDRRKYEPQLIAYAEAIRDRFKENSAVRGFIAAMENAKPASVGQPAPLFTAASLDGKIVKLSDFRGKYVLVDFWASWCPPCRQENPNIVKLYRRYHEHGLQLLGVSLDTDHDAWQKAVITDRLTWTQVSDQQRFDGPAEKRYQIEEIPSNFIIDPKGVIVGKNLFGKELITFLKRIFLINAESSHA
ncbi:TlpA disulfide reductase family protein [Mucilaginibacter jinjuensis]|uniref:TlpA disulfide reductase family protein n=1 Tax=Mucilaginibacter jinjuensis TaxID=1176721 RepID=A0ABY7TB13_9SPHI|nr:TlpA disulfide reductase family protein [Mucilaginibacter jinjuensis]WCT13393.1 TlpA disulfide reductase family protein [Mucilaginibacter jinjuensis]